MALLIGSAVSSGGVAVVVVSKLIAPKGEKSLAENPKAKNRQEGAWAK
ncbi:MAG: hypothetical protein ACRETD_05840 [Steroidobacteraceae bacterium]